MGTTYGISLNKLTGFKFRNRSWKSIINKNYWGLQALLTSGILNLNGHEVQKLQLVKEISKIDVISFYKFLFKLLLSIHEKKKEKLFI